VKPYWLTALNGGVNIFKLMAGATGTASARTEVLQRATSPGTERGSDEGSGEHEGQWQTDRREEASNGKALSDLPALKPYWGKPAVRNFREGQWKRRHHAKPATRLCPTRPIKRLSCFLRLFEGLRC